MNSFFSYFLIAFCVSSLCMPVFVRMSRLLGAVSETGGRHIGKFPVGRLGGVGALSGILVTIVFELLVDPSIRVAFDGVQQQMVGLTVGLGLVAAVGFVDDIRRLPAVFKLVVQVIASILAYVFGLRISGVDLPFLDPIQLGWLSFPMTVLWIVGIVNAVNLIDGLDGLAGGVLLFASLVNFAAALGLDAVVPAAIMISMAGSILGFLVFNWYPAKIYLGDGGAYSFGFLLAVSGLLAPVQKASTGISLLVPLLAVGLPVFDTLLTMLRRSINRRGIFLPDRGHLHHILLDAGISHRRVVFGLYTISCVLCSSALIIVYRRNQIIGYIFVAASIFGCFIWGFLVKSQLRKVISSVIKSGSDLWSRKFDNN